MIYLEQLREHDIVLALDVGCGIAVSERVVSLIDDREGSIPDVLGILRVELARIEPFLREVACRLC